MSLFLQLEALVGPAVIAWLALRVCVQRRTLAAMMELAGIAIALAIGVTSSVFFLWRLLGLPSRSYWVFDLAAQAFLFGALFVRRRNGPRVDTASHHAPRTPRHITEILGGAIAVIAVCAGTALLLRNFAELPHGWWDGWAIWNLRAAFLSVPTAHWRDGFTGTLAWSHPDYPLLVPASIARLWSVGDNATTSGPLLVAAAFVLSSALVLAGSVARRGGTAAMGLALSLMLIPAYLYWGASQTADVPLGTYLLIAVAALATAEDRSAYAIAGLATGFALWTKNEGVVIAAAISVMLAVLALRSRQWRSIVDFGLAVLVGGLTLLTFKVVLAPPSELLHQILTQGPLDKALDLKRHGFLAWRMAREFVAWGNLPVIPASVLVFATVMLTAFRRGQRSRRPIAVGVGVVGVVLCGYYVIYLLTPYDLEWHLRSSWSRLIAQIWPTVTWTAVAAMGKKETLEIPAA